MSLSSHYNRLKKRRKRAAKYAGVKLAHRTRKSCTVGYHGMKAPSLSIWDMMVAFGDSMKNVVKPKMQPRQKSHERQRK